MALSSTQDRRAGVSRGFNPLVFHSSKKPKTSGYLVMPQTMPQLTNAVMFARWHTGGNSIEGVKGQSGSH
ncbi:MAG: hypothetical protein ACRBBT_06275 [Paracoccaceae bacterium]